MHVVSVAHHVPTTFHSRSAPLRHESYLGGLTCLRGTAIDCEGLVASWMDTSTQMSFSAFRSGHQDRKKTETGPDCNWG
jgi:hypothetical protein